MYENRIRHLEESHAILDKEIDKLERSGVFDDAHIQTLKKKKLHLRTEIVRLQHEQLTKQEDRTSD